MESKVRRLERHLFMRKFGYATLDEGVERNPSWEIELEENWEFHKLNRQLTQRLSYELSILNFF